MKPWFFLVLLVGCEGSSSEPSNTPPEVEGDDDDDADGGLMGDPPIEDSDLYDLCYSACEDGEACLFLWGARPIDGIVQGLCTNRCTGEDDTSCGEAGVCVASEADDAPYACRERCETDADCPSQPALFCHADGYCSPSR